MSEKLEKLSEESIAKFPEYVDTWIKFGIDIEKRLDKDRVPSLLKSIYEMSELNPVSTENIIFARCPIEASVLIGVLMEPKRRNALDKILAENAVARKFYDNCLNLDTGQYSDKYKEEIAFTRTVIKFDYINDVFSGNPFNLGHFLHGNTEAYWFSYYDFYTKETDIELIDLSDYIEFSSMSGWWAPFDDHVIVCEKPTKEILFDDRNLLHTETRPAIFFYENSPSNVYAWHGVKYNKRWADNLTPERALSEENLELRRVACEMLGWATILRELDCNVIDRNENPEIGELVSVNIPDIGREQYLRVMCGTGREFALPVPPDMKTAHQANAWTYGLDINDYQPEVRT